MEDVIEYNFSTQPAWISDAIEFTETGIELNFHKLSSMCGQSALPTRLCIILEGSHAVLYNSEQNIPEANTKEGISNTKLNCADADLLSVEDSKTRCQRNAKPTEMILEPLNSNNDYLNVPKERRGNKSVQRRESVLSREIRLQTEKENEFRTERLRALRQLRRNRLKEKNFSDDSSSISNISSDDGAKSAHHMTSDISKVSSQPPDVSVSSMEQNPLTGNTSSRSHVAASTESKVSSFSSEKGLTSRAFTQAENQSLSTADDMTVSSSSGPRMLTTVQKRIVTERVKQTLNRSNSTADSQTKPKSRREILRSKLQSGGDSKTEAATVNSKHEASISNRSHNNNRRYDDGSTRPSVDSHMREREEELRNFEIKV